MTAEEEAEFVEPSCPSSPSVSDKIRWVCYFTWVGCTATPGFLYNVLFHFTEVMDIFG